MVETVVRSRMREIAMVLSSLPESNFEREGKCNAVTFEECDSSAPNSRFRGFSDTFVSPRVGIWGIEALAGIEEEERLKTLTFSSDPPVARYTVASSEVASGNGDSARQRIDESWALNRNVSENSTVDGEVLADEVFEMDAVMPCSTRSYEPVMI